MTMRRERLRTSVKATGSLGNGRACCLRFNLHRGRARGSSRVSHFFYFFCVGCAVRQEPDAASTDCMIAVCIAFRSSEDLITRLLFF